MRRSDRALSHEEALAIIDHAPFGTVAMCGKDGLPYCVPLNLVRVNNDLYFHCALSGTKSDLLRSGGRVCITFVTQAQPGYQAEKNNFTCFYRSAIVTGQAHEVLDPLEKTEALRAICQRFLPDAMVGDNFSRAAETSLHRTGIWRISMDQITGKSRPERN